MYCKYCGALIDDDSAVCPFCGKQLNGETNYGGTSQLDYTYKGKNKLVTAILAIVLGDLGIHYFYLGKTGLGVLMLVFCWTGIPAIIGLIQGILILLGSNEDFQRKVDSK